LQNNMGGSTAQNAFPAIARKPLRHRVKQPPVMRNIPVHFRLKVVMNTPHATGFGLSPGQ
jgi:hypothetical protein